MYTRIPDISAPEPNFQIANFINGINSLPATWTPEESTEKQEAISLSDSSNGRRGIPRLRQLIRFLGPRACSPDIDVKGELSWAQGPSGGPRRR